MAACLSPNGLNTYAFSSPASQLLVGSVDGLRTLEREPAGHWRAGGQSLAGKHISSLLYEPSHGGLFAGVHGGGLHFSADGGQTWELRARGLTVEHVFSLASAVEDGHVVLYAGTEPAHLFRSADYAESWRELPALREVPELDKWMFPGAPHEAHLKCLAIDPRSPSTMYAGVEQGALLLTADGGRSWRELDGYSRPDDEVYKDVHLALLRPSNPDEMYMTAGMGLYHSADRGETWEHLSDRKARVGYPDQFQFSPLDDSVLFMAGAAQNPGTWRQSHHADSTIVRSRDGGRTWQEAGVGLPEHMRGNIEAMGVAGWPGGYELFVATTDGEVYASVDEAEHWILAASGLAPISKGGHYVPLRAA
jgi:photosystem II stability/assembly factor-like uncharacterized protein